MAYGALKVKTNLVLEDEDDESYGVITVFSSDGVLKAYGTTGMDGSHTFRPAAWGLHCHCSLLQRRSGRLGACFPTGFCWRRRKQRLSLSLNCNRPSQKQRLGTNSRRAWRLSICPAPHQLHDALFPPCQCAP